MTDAGPPIFDSGADGNPWVQLRAIIERLADGIVIVDHAGSIRFANPAAADLFNRTPSELTGTMLGTPLVAGETTEMEIVRRGGGEPVYAELRASDIRWEGEVVELVSLRDITDRKHDEERVRQLSHEREARIKAESASRTKSDFLAIMSHELRTPLNAILGYSELIELGISGEVNATMLDQIARIRGSARHLLGLVNDILDLAKVEAGRLTVANVPSSVAEAVMSAMILIQPQASTRNLIVAVSPDLGRVPPYIGDGERVRQILVNVLSNAVKFTAPGGRITIDATVPDAVDPQARLETRHSYVRISVCDTGAGIAPEKLRAIFEPFVQAESGRKRTHEGSGLGLTIGRRLARAMGGDLTVESTAGDGSTFHLYLPAERSAAQAPDGSSTDASLAETEERSSSGRGFAEVRDLRGLTDVARGILTELEPTVSAVVDRIRSDPAIGMAAGLRTSQVTDHLPTLIADIAGALVVVEETSDEPSPLMADAMEIQRLVAERHGAQRARLGWTEASLRREFMLIREQVEQVVRRTVPPHGTMEPAQAVALVNRFLDQAEFIGVRSLEKERAE